MKRRTRKYYDEAKERIDHPGSTPLDQRKESQFNLKRDAEKEAAWWCEALGIPPSATDLYAGLASEFENIGNKAFIEGVAMAQTRARDKSIVKGKLLRNCVLLTRSFRGAASKQADRYAVSAIKKIVEAVEEIEAMQIMDVIEEGFEK